MKVSQIARKHPDWNARKEYWKDASLLYQDGYEIKRYAQRFLKQRPAEPKETYASRVDRFSYQNILGTAIGFYASRLFKDEPQISLRNSSEATVEDDGMEKFEEDADRGGTSLVDLAKQWFARTVLLGSQYVLIDLPKTDGFSNFRQQKESGALDPYLVTFDPVQLINWSKDQFGQLEWAVIATHQFAQVFGEAPTITDRWYYFDRTDYSVYASTRPAEATESSDSADDRDAVLVSQGKHALAELQRVPIHCVEVPMELFLADRVYTQVLDHLNADNAYSWALNMGCFPIPVVKGEFDGIKASETAYIQVPDNGDFFFREPSGAAYDAMAKRIESLKEEIHRQMYLQHQARSSSASASAQSGYSKAMDTAPSQQVLNAYGAIMRKAMEAVLADALYIRRVVDVTAQVEGLTFEDRDELNELAIAEAALDMDIPSDSWRKHIQKKIACELGAGAPLDTRKIWEKEIDAAPKQSDIEAQARQDQQQQFTASFDKKLAGLAV